MDSSISFTLTEYRNGERRFLVQQGGEVASFYYLNSAFLVKGYSAAQVEQFGENMLSRMPMALAVPIAILSQTVPDGPCTVVDKRVISAPLSRAMRLQDRQLTNAVGELAPSAPSEVTYQFDVSLDPPALNKSSVRYAGTIQFSPREEAPADDTDVSGYLVVGRGRPFPVAGRAGVPVTLGAVRQYLVSSAEQQAPPPPAESLYVVRTKDQGITDFDLTVTETSREPNKSFLSVPGFHKRSATGSRWLMCAYTDLAIKRGFKYWSVIYPEEGSDILIVGFPKSQEENISQTLGSEFAGKNVVPEKPASVDVLVRTLCGGIRR
ncbi:MAG: hypothetical protein ACOY3Z_06725 [Thermodesulfobacteriota bacterium]